jgi:hypothetical protein
MRHDETDDINHRFLIKLCETTDGNSDIQVSTPDIGVQMGLDKGAAGQAAENLIGSGYVEIRTLSGGIGITPEGVRKARKLGANLSSENDKPRLNKEPVVDETGRQAVDGTLDAIKSQAGHLGLAYDKLDELLADLKTIDAQMLSPFPKTDIIRHTFLSIRGILNGPQAKDCGLKIDDLLDL